MNDTFSSKRVGNPLGLPKRRRMVLGLDDKGLNPSSSIYYILQNTFMIMDESPNPQVSAS